GYNDPDAWRLDDVTLTAVGAAPPPVAGSISINDVSATQVATPPPPSGKTIVGTSGNDVLVGTAGNDTIRGLAGNDTINGAGGADTLSGGKGHDLFVFHAGEADGDLILDFYNQGP